MNIPLAEHFHSTQGEGVHVGRPMHFLRLPGCSVGKRDPQGPLLPTGAAAWKCHTWDGRPFHCDTDFNKHEEVPLQDLMNETWEHRLCLTGGEPLVHSELVMTLEEECARRLKHCHIETSGTIRWQKFYDATWLTVSPKLGALPEMLVCADEIKLLVDTDFDLQSVPQEIRNRTNVFVQPVNYLASINFASVEKCLEVLRAFPGWRLSPQVHKLLFQR